MKSLKILITGAAGQIACNFIPLVANGNVFGQNQHITLSLLEIPQVMKKLKGVQMEIEDCAYELLDEVIISDSPEEACRDIDYAVLIGGYSIRGDWKNFERESLLTGNVPIFTQMGKALNKYAKKSVKVVVVANPANTNASTVIKYAPSIPKENITALSRLDYNRAVSLIARKLNVKNSEVKNIAVWGNHSRTMIGDASKAIVQTKSASEMFKDSDFLEKEFVDFLRQRFFDIIEFRGVTSSLSAANAIKDHLFSWHFGTSEGEHVAMCVVSDGNPYGVKPGLVFSFPVTIKDGKWSFAEGFEFDERMKKLIKITEDELCSEVSKANELCE